MSSIAPLGPLAMAGAQPSTAAGKPGDFRSLVEDAIGNVERQRAEAGQAVEAFLSGENQELHSALLAAQRAELSLELFLQARNKVVQAYQEIMRMQL